ncbi:MAG: glycosyltransferase [Desulfobacteraceae bacterium]|nr:MAG: glycosyltransferase [Desulfobacteraceae bacterium]
MKVLHLVDSLVMGGKERRLAEFLKHMRSGCAVENHLVVLSEIVDYAYVRELGIPITYLKRAYPKDLSIFAKLFSLCRQNKPDIIHSWESMCSVYAAPVARLLNIKFINAMISNASRIRIGGRKWVRARLTFPFSDLILANSRSGLSAYHAPPHKSAHVHNGFDFDRVRVLDPAYEIRSAHGIRTPHVVGMVASVDHRKDHANFVRTAIAICAKRNDVSFIAIGDGPLLNRCRRMVPGPLADRILFLGRRSNVESYVQLFTIGLLLTYGEGISNAIMEYMALGKPVIATLGGGTSELVVDKQTGFLIPSNTDARLAEYIHDLLDNPALAEKMGRTGKERIKSLFSIEKMCAEILAWYRACLNGKIKQLRAEAHNPAVRFETASFSKNPADGTD